MATKKTPNPPKRRDAASARPPRQTTPHQPQSAASRRAAHPEPQAHAPTRRPRRRRRQTLGQRLRHLSVGSWFAIITGALVIGIIAFAVIASRGSATGGSATTSALLATGTPAPAINALPAADGKNYSLAQYKWQKVVVLEFFAPWCPHCQNETTTLRQFQ